MDLYAILPTVAPRENYPPPDYIAPGVVPRIVSGILPSESVPRARIMTLFGPPDRLRSRYTARCTTYPLYYRRYCSQSLPV